MNVRDSYLEEDARLLNKALLKQTPEEKAAFEDLKKKVRAMRAASYSS